MRKDRQTLLFSATWPVEVQLLAERLLSDDHVLVEVGGALASAGRANESIVQQVRRRTLPPLNNTHPSLTQIRCISPRAGPSSTQTHAPFFRVNLSQVTICDAESKLKTLVALLEKLMDGSRLLIFASSKKRCDELTKELRIDGWWVAARPN